MSKKRIVLIPYWVQEIVKRANLPLAACLEFGKIKAVMSLNDLIGFCTLQQYFKHVLNAEMFDELFSIWLDSIPNDQPELRSYFTEQVYPLACDDSFRKEIWGRLFEVEARSKQYEVPFITYDLTPTVCGVVICPGYFVNDGTADLQRSLIQAILEVLYVYDTFSDVAKTSLFKRYLELLSPSAVAAS